MLPFLLRGVSLWFKHSYSFAQYLTRKPSFLSHTYGISLIRYLHLLFGLKKPYFSIFLSLSESFKIMGCSGSTSDKDAAVYAESPFQVWIHFLGPVNFCGMNSMCFSTLVNLSIEISGGISCDFIVRVWTWDGMRNSAFTIYRESNKPLSGIIYLKTH